MRDLLLLGLLPIFIYYAIRKPFIGLSLWLWTSLVPMQTWSYGLATEVRWNMVFAICTMIGYFFMKNKPKMKVNAIVVSMLFFFFIATVSSIFHQGFDALVWDRWERFLKAMVFFTFACLIVDKKLHVNALMWACALSITAASAQQGVKTLISGGGHVSYGFSEAFNDNNLAALATLLCIPFTLYLVSQYRHVFVIKVGLLFAVLISVIFVLGSDSRGGVIGLAVLAGYYFIKSKHKIPILVLGATALAVGLSLMDDSWFERMNTIKTADEDSSFMGRVISWKFSILMAMQSPLFGGGFDSTAYGLTQNQLMRNWSALDFIQTPYPETSHVAHSIYFQVLGDLGFLGLFVYLMMLFRTYRNFKSIGNLATNKEPWLDDIALYMKLSMICFFVAGAALSAAYNEIIFTIICLGMRISQISQK